jgi:hypothetical protein
MCPMIRIDGCGARRKRSALACRRSTAALAAANERRSSAPATRFLGPGRSAQSRWFERSRAFLSGRYPLLPVPVQRVSPADRSWCRPGVYPRSRPGAAVTSRRPREPLSLRPPASPASVLLRERDSIRSVSETETPVNKKGTRKQQDAPDAEAIIRQLTKAANPRCGDFHGTGRGQPVTAGRQMLAYRGVKCPRRDNRP